MNCLFLNLFENSLGWDLSISLIDESDNIFLPFEVKLFPNLQRSVGVEDNPQAEYTVIASWGFFSLFHYCNSLQYFCH